MTLKSDNIYLSSHPENMQAENRVIPVENEMVNGIEHEGQGGTGASQHQERVSFASHGEYREYVRKALGRRLGHQATLEWVRHKLQRLLTVWVLDLTVMQERLRALYSSSPVGKPSYDPQILLRSLLLMPEFGFNSIKKWVAELQSRPLLAIFTGADPEELPAASTYYDFLMRLENGPHQPKCRHVVRHSEERHARKRKLHAAESRPTGEPEHDVEDRRGVIQRFVEATIGLEAQPVPQDLAQRLNAMLLELGVKVSLAHGIIQNEEQLTLAGDGTAIGSGGSPDGKRTCDCWQRGEYRCDCERQYADADAQWGWDNRHKCYFYGYRLFQMVCADNHHDLPVYLALAGAKRHEVLQAIECISRLRKEWVEAKIARTSFDALFDMHPFYEYLVHCQIGYAIPYKQEPARCVLLGHNDIPCSADGIPLCPGGKAMLYHMTDRQGRHMYHCPIKRNTHRNHQEVIVTHLDECPLHALCEPDSKLGPSIYVAPHENPRLHPRIPRESKEYKELRNMRGCCERSNSIKKEYYGADDLNTRVMSYAFIRLTLISILEHSRVRAMQLLAPLRQEHRLDTANDLLRVFS